MSILIDRDNATSGGGTAPGGNAITMLSRRSSHNSGKVIGQNEYKFSRNKGTKFGANMRTAIRGGDA